MSSFKGLGKGLGALFQDDAPASVERTEAITNLSIIEVGPNPEQPRKEFNQEALEDLAASIVEQGILQPILVRRSSSVSGPRYEIIAGERRWRAAGKAGLTDIPAIIKELNDQETLAIALIENLQREDLNPLEEALGIKKLKDEFGLSQEDLAKRLGKSRSAIANTLRLLNLPDEARQDLLDGKITQGHARALLALGSADEQRNFLEAIKRDKLSVRELEGAIAAGRTGLAPEPEQHAASQQAPASKKPLPQSAILLQLQAQIAQAVHLPVKLTGHSNKGRLSIQFASRDELERLIMRLGVTADSLIGEEE